MKTLKDANFAERDVALPNGNATTYSMNFDLGSVLGTGNERPEMELIITVPNLTTTHLPNGQDLKVSVLAGAAATPSSAIAQSVAVYTGAGDVGATGSTTRYRIPPNCPRYLRVAFAGSATAGNMSALDAEVSLGF